MKIIASCTVLILCLVATSFAVPINGELPSSANEFLISDNGSEENSNRVVRQVAVNVGPVGVGVGPFGGVGVRVGNLFNLGVAPSN